MANQSSVESSNSSNSSNEDDEATKDRANEVTSTTKAVNSSSDRPGTTKPSQTIPRRLAQEPPATTVRPPASTTCPKSSFAPQVASAKPTNDAQNVKPRPASTDLTEPPRKRQHTQPATATAKSTSNSPPTVSPTKTKTSPAMTDHIKQIDALKKNGAATILSAAGFSGKSAHNSAPGSPKQQQHRPPQHVHQPQPLHPQQPQPQQEAVGYVRFSTPPEAMQFKQGLNHPAMGAVVVDGRGMVMMDPQQRQQLMEANRQPVPFDRSRMQQFLSVSKEGDPPPPQVKAEHVLNRLISPNGAKRMAQMASGTGTKRKAKRLTTLRAGLGRSSSANGVARGQTGSAPPSQLGRSHSLGGTSLGCMSRSHSTNTNDDSDSGPDSDDEYSIQASFKLNEKQEVQLRKRLAELSAELQFCHNETKGLAPQDRKRIRNRKASRVSRLKKKLHVYDLQRNYGDVISEKTRQEQLITDLTTSLRDTATHLLAEEPDYKCKLFNLKVLRDSGELIGHDGKSRMLKPPPAPDPSMLTRDASGLKQHEGEPTAHGQPQQQFAHPVQAQYTYPQQMMMQPGGQQMMQGQPMFPAQPRMQLPPGYRVVPQRTPYMHMPGATNGTPPRDAPSRGQGQPQIVAPTAGTQVRPVAMPQAQYMHMAQPAHLPPGAVPVSVPAAVQGQRQQQGQHAVPVVVQGQRQQGGPHQSQQGPSGSVPQFAVNANGQPVKQPQYYMYQNQLFVY